MELHARCLNNTEHMESATATLRRWTSMQTWTALSRLFVGRPPVRSNSGGRESQSHANTLLAADSGRFGSVVNLDQKNRGCNRGKMGSELPNLAQSNRPQASDPPFPQLLMMKALPPTPACGLTGFFAASRHLAMGSRASSRALSPGNLCFLEDVPAATAGLAPQAPAAAGGRCIQLAHRNA